MYYVFLVLLTGSEFVEIARLFYDLSSVSHAHSENLRCNKNCYMMCISAYQITYGDALVWQPYRRNHKGGIPPEKTRRTCIVRDCLSIISVLCYIASTATLFLREI